MSNNETIPSSSSSSQPSVSSSPPNWTEIQSYLREHHLEEVHRDMMAALLFYKPTKPLEFMIQGLQFIQKAMEEGNYSPQMHAETFSRCADMIDSSSATLTSSRASSKTKWRGEEVSRESETQENRMMDTTTNPMDHPSLSSFSETLNVFSVAYHARRRGSVSAESIDPNSAEASEKITIPKSDDARRRIASAIAHNLLFRNLERDQKREIVDAMFERSCNTGEKVIVQGDEGDNFYVVDSGLFYVFVDGEKVVEIGPGGSFGELALMYNTPRAATVQAVTSAVIWGVDRMTFRRTIMNNMYRKRKTYEAFLRTVPILQTLNATEVAKIADSLEPVEYNEGETIIEQGDIGDTFYLMLEGEALVKKTLQPSVQSEEVGHLRPGDYFGEISLITDQPRAASVIAAAGGCRCVYLDRPTFIRLLGPCMDLLKRNMEQYKKYEKVIAQQT
jgi:cAMP-dependent protein kinase regulator